MRMYANGISDQTFNLDCAGSSPVVLASNLANAKCDYIIPTPKLYGDIAQLVERR